VIVWRDRVSLGESVGQFGEQGTGAVHPENGPIGRLGDFDR
jgi:hypothetical protein